MEVLIVVGVLSLLAGVVIQSYGSHRAAVEQAKLHADVTVLNQAVKMYVAEGGSLDGASTYQKVIEQLKTKSSAGFARRHVGPNTGRFVDPRLAARELSASQVSSKLPRAVWNAAEQKFVIATEGAGIGSFYFDNEQAGKVAAEDTRQRSNMLYNRADGWIWEWGGHPDPAPLAPDNYVVDGLPSNDPEPLPGTPPSIPVPPGDGPVGSFVPAPEPLPQPTILPVGGVFSVARFPSSIAVSANGADSSASVLQYRLDTGSWQPYSSAFTVTPGTRVFARNFSLDTARFITSTEDTEVYFQLVPLFTGTVTPQWTNIAGKENLVQTINNLLLSDVKATYGLPAGINESSNSLGFRRVGVISTPPDTDFRVGEIRYYNGTVAGGTEATSIDLKLNIQLLTPIVQSGGAVAKLSLWSSTNTHDERASADYAQLDNPTTDFTFHVDGVTYTLKLRFANVKAEEGWTDGTKLYVYEDSTGHADLLGRFESSY